MATLNATRPTMADVARRLDPNGKVDKLVEILNQTNEILDDMVFVEGNLPTGHKTTVRTGLPSATWRLLNYGVQPSKSLTAQVTDTCGMLEAYAEVDKRLADLNGNTAEFRLSEDRAFIESMSQQMAQTLFYGNTTVNPERFLGLAPRYAALSGAASAANILSGSGSGNTNTSIWLLCWGENTIHGIYPKGTKVGLQHEDKGQVTLQDAAGGNYEGYRSHYLWDIGLTVRDWRYACRIANVDVTALTKDAATGADIIDLMVQALEVLPDVKMGRAAFYCNRTIRSFLRRQIANKKNVHLSMQEIAGKKVVAFDEIPVRRVDQILNTEATVS